MSTKLLLSVGALAGCLLLGCSDESTPDYDAEARQQIDESNMDQQLQSLEKEINAPDPDLP
jgi:hypothetical protein